MFLGFALSGLDYSVVLGKFSVLVQSKTNHFTLGYILVFGVDLFNGILSVARISEAKFSTY